MSSKTKRTLTAIASRSAYVTCHCARVQGLAHAAASSGRARPSRTRRRA